MKRIFFTTVFLCVPFMWCASNAAAAVYKWVDKDGNVHFSQTPRDADSSDDYYDLRYQRAKEPPPAPVKQSDNKTDGANSKDGKLKIDRPLTPEEKVAAMQKKQQDDAKKEAEEAKQAAEKEQKCERAQQRLANINDGGRVYEVGKDGQRKYWDDNTRSQKRAEAQGHVDKWCN